MRWVDQALGAARERYNGRDRLIVVHGNRIILWAAMSHLKLNKASVSDFRPPFSRDRVDALTMLAAKGLNHVVLKEYPEAYPAPLFKKPVEVQGNRLQAAGLPVQGRRKKHVGRSRYARFVPGCRGVHHGPLSGPFISLADSLGCRYSGSSLSRCPLGRWRGATTWKSRRSRAATSCRSSRSARAITQASTAWSRSDE